MKQFEKDELLRKLRERQLHLASVMVQSDAHASKCVKLGLNFAEAYPGDYEEYVMAREEYNANEEEMARIQVIEAEPDDPREESDGVEVLA